MASGEFVHADSSGTVLAAGTWTATELLEFQPYGCGVVHNFPTPGATTPLPPDVCGGAVKLSVALTPDGTNLAIPGTLTIFCIIGPDTPNSHDDPTGEGIHTSSTAASTSPYSRRTPGSVEPPALGTGLDNTTSK